MRVLKPCRSYRLFLHRPYWGVKKTALRVLVTPSTELIWPRISSKMPPYKSRALWPLTLNLQNPWLLHLARFLLNGLARDGGALKDEWPGKGFHPWSPCQDGIQLLKGFRAELTITDENLLKGELYGKSNYGTLQKPIPRNPF